MVNLLQKSLSLISIKFKEDNLMKKNLFLGVFLVAISGFAQEKVNHSELQKIATEVEAEYKDAIQLEKVKYAGHGSEEGVSFQGFANGIPYYYALDSKNQIASMNVDKLGNNTIPGVAVTGEGMTAFIWDGGKARLTHNEFSGRATQVEFSGSDSDHATGVGAVIIGAGVVPIALGMAPTANLKVMNFTVGNTITEMAYHSNQPENADYMISNHSYGSLTGWSYRGSDGWYWYGYPHISPTESALFGFYTSNDANYDNVAFNAPQHSIFKSSGNNNGEGPSGTVNHYAYDETNQWVYYTGVYRPRDCTANGGYDCLSFSGSIAKNIILVGAVKPLPGSNRYTGPSDVVATDFTSFGPTDDGRIKPDVVAVGQNVYAATNTADDAYINWAGTSFSSPAAAGVGLLLQQVKKETGTGYLRSDMMRALLINSANEAGIHLGPDYKFGYGLINALGAAETLLNSNGKSYTNDLILQNNETFTMSFKAVGGEPIKATIAWLDPAGTPLPQLALNDRTPMLVNDLDLRITNGGNTYYPWKLNPDSPASAATQEDNTIDNAEQVFIENPVAGQTYTLTVNHKGNLVNGSQNFALAISGVESALSTVDMALNNSVRIFPNPVNDKLNIQIDKNLSNVQIKVFDMMGQTAYLNKFNSLKNTESIDLKHLAPGVYMVYIKSDEGTMTKKIIKK